MNKKLSTESILQNKFSAHDPPNPAPEATPINIQTKLRRSRDSWHTLQPRLGSPPAKENSLFQGARRSFRARGTIETHP